MKSAYPNRVSIFLSHLSHYSFLQDMPITLYELNSLVKETLEHELPDTFWVQGELCEGRQGYGGHFYGELVPRDEEADRIVESARENINYEKLKAMHDLKNQIATLSIEIAEKLISAELSDKTKANDLIARELENAKLN